MCIRDSIKAKHQTGTNHHQSEQNKLDTLLSSQKTPAHQSTAVEPRFGACVPTVRHKRTEVLRGPGGVSAGLVTAPRGARSVRRLADRREVTRALPSGSN